jgi:hypothetical protein
MVLMALLSTVLVGFVGLVIDGGEVASRQQALQGVADGSAVTGAYAIGKQGASLATATTVAQNVPTRVGFPASDLVMSYLDGTGAVTATPSLVRTVKAVVTDTRATYFVALIGIPTVQVTATAKATVGSVTPACALCVNSATGNSLHLGASSTVTVTGGPVVVNSTGNPNISLGNSASLTAPAITMAGGGYTVGTGTTLTPTPVVGSPFTDPYAGTATPVGAGAPKAFTSAGSGNLSPGVYTSIFVSQGNTITLLTGTYVVTGRFDVDGTLLTGAGGVIVYFTCPIAPCSGAGAGGYFSLNNSAAATITAQTSGTYAGIAVLSDPGDKSGDTTNDGKLTVNGAYDAPAKAFSLTNNGDWANFGGITVVKSLNLATSGTSVTVNAPSSGASGIPALAP